MDIPAAELNAMVAVHETFAAVVSDPPPARRRQRMHKKGPSSPLPMAVPAMQGNAAEPVHPVAAPGHAEEPATTLATDGPTGPPQTGRGSVGQYVYWITMSCPTDETVARLGLRRPREFTREEFAALMVKAHGEKGVDIVETASFQELHANAEIHQNALVRSKRQYRWRSAAEHLARTYKVHVDFGQNVRTWCEGVIYGRVASDHKPPETLDKKPVQWAKEGDPVRFEDVIPRKWQAPGFVRATKMTPLAFYDKCKEHGVTSEKKAWELAVDLEDKGDRGLMAFMQECRDTAGQVARVHKALTAKEKRERAAKTRVQILAEAAASPCSP